MPKTDGPTPFNGPGPSASGGEGFAPGTYNLSESDGPAGYTASEWVCEGGARDDKNTITVGQGETVVCTITNNDISREPLIFSNGFESN